MAQTIFYSWQSDLPNSTNRSFLEDVLEKAIKTVAADTELAEAEREALLVLDKDTKGVPGTPPIADVIFEKISGCDVFVPDLTFVGSTTTSRLLPNPNVLIEYGWALSSLGHSKIVPIMNTAYGDVTMETLPFDMRHLRRPITYSLDEKTTPEDRVKIKETLVRQVTEAIRLILSHSADTDASASVSAHTLIPSTSGPSTFLAEGETIELHGSFGSEDRVLALPDHQHLYMRLAPVSKVELINSTREAKDLINKGGVRPLGGSQGGWNSGRNQHGGFVVSDSDGSILCLTQLFLNQEIWGIDTFALDFERVKGWADGKFGYIAGGYIESACISTLEGYLRLYREVLNVQPPVQLIVGLTSVKGYRMCAPEGQHFGGYEKFGGRVVEDNLEWTCQIDDLKKNPKEILEPFITYLWEECGLTPPSHAG